LRKSVFVLKSRSGSDRLRLRSRKESRETAFASSRRRGSAKNKRRCAGRSKRGSDLRKRSVSERQSLKSAAWRKNRLKLSKRDNVSQLRRLLGSLR